MPKINVLPRELAELIAAGEVVERPASVVKEMVENSIDSGATHITVEIKRGGVTYIRVTDDGCGISPSDVPLAFLRHATSKIIKADDLYSISTLGFRGEALAATSSVSRIEMFTKRKEDTLGTHYEIEGGEEILNEESGCPDGTTIIVRDLFYNTPARMKFLKTDMGEGNAVTAVCERAALSHPEIAFKLIRDGRQTISTSGDNKLHSAIYSVLGREFAGTLVEVNTTLEGIGVSGYTCKPIYCRQSKTSQIVFLNGRFVRSGTVSAAVERAYKNSAMVGKYPAFVLNLTVPFGAVDVNVHPAKTEIRFSDEKRIFDAVYYGVKSAIEQGDTRPSVNIGTPKKAIPLTQETESVKYRQSAVDFSIYNKNMAEKTYTVPPKPQSIDKPKEKPPVLYQDNTPFFERKDVKDYLEKREVTGAQPKTEAKPEEEREEYIPEKEVRLIGEAFATYIVVEQGESVFLIDKHAAHERILFNDLKKNQAIETQNLLAPVTVRLEAEEYTAVLDNSELLLKAGFDIEEFGSNTVIVRAIPSMLCSEDVSAIVSEAAASLAKTGRVDIERIEDIFHTVSCKAAIKAGYITTDTELLSLAKRVLGDRDVMYCPHGRPVAFEIKKKDLEKQFGRIQ